MCYQRDSVDQKASAAFDTPLGMVHATLDEYSCESRPALGNEQALHARIENTSRAVQL